MFDAVVLAPVVGADDDDAVDDTGAVVSSVDVVDAACVEDSVDVAGGVDVCSVDVLEDITGCVVGPHSPQYCEQ